MVNDFQTIEHDGKLYAFRSTVGLIFVLEDFREISFEIGTWFSEMMTIRKGYNWIEKFVPIEEWENCEGYVPKCPREIIEIK